MGGRREEGGQYYISRKVVFSLECLNIFAMLQSKTARVINIINANKIEQILLNLIERFSELHLE